MKKNIIIFTAGLFFACNNASTSTTENVKTVQASTEIKVTTDTENIAQEKFVVEGMHCQHGCAARIAKVLNASQGVVQAQVNFDTKEATVTYDKQVLSVDEIAKIIAKVGDGESYTAKVLQN